MNEGISTSYRGRQISESREKRSSGSSDDMGPRFAPEVQYWAFGTALFASSMEMMSWVTPLAVVVEIILYALTWWSGLQWAW